MLWVDFDASLWTSARGKSNLVLLLLSCALSKDPHLVSLTNHTCTGNPHQIGVHLVTGMALVLPPSVVATAYWCYCVFLFLVALLYLVRFQVLQRVLRSVNDGRGRSISNADEHDRLREVAVD